MNTAVWTVVVDDYLPEMCSVTLPNIRQYADKIGAEFHVITERRFPTFPPSYEKLQIHERGRDYDYNILVDADIILHPDMVDPRRRINRQTLGTYFGYDLRVAMKRLDPGMESYAASHGGRYHGIVTNFLCASHDIHDIWTPLDVPFEECRDWCCRPHILDEYAVSRNLGLFNIPYGAILMASEQWMIYHVKAEDRNVDGPGGYRANLETARALVKDWGS